MTAEDAEARPVDAFWRTLTRWDATKIVPVVAIRNTAGFTIAFVVAAALGGVNAGVLAALGALNVSYSDGLDPYVLRVRRIMRASVLCGIAVAIGAISGNSRIAAILTATLSAFTAGMLVALGTRAGDLGVITLVTLVVFAARPLAAVDAFESGLVALAGGQLQALLSIAFWPVKQYQPERRIIGELYRAIAKIGEEAADASAPPPVSRQITDAQQALSSLAQDHSVEAERHVFLLNQAERIRLSMLNLSRLSRRMARERNADAIASSLTDVLGAARAAVIEIGYCVTDGKEKASPGEAVNEFSAAAKQLREVDARNPPPLVAALVADAGREVDALGGQLRAAAGVAANLIEIPENGSSAAEPEPWYLRLPEQLAKLRANLSFHSTVFRHAIRLAVCLGAGDALGRAISLQRTYWIPMTIAIVLKPDFTATFSRGILRIAGTFAGLFLATELFHHMHVGIATDIAMMTVFVFLLRWIGPANYGVFVAALSAMVVLLIATTGVNPRIVIAARAENTAIGGVLALAAYALWPTWEKTQIGTTLAEMIDSYRVYFDCVIQAYAGQPRTDVDSCRLAARLARSNAEASVDRISAEPGVSREQIAALGAIMANSHSFIHAAMAMESGLYHTESAPVRAATQTFAQAVGEALEMIAAWLRRGDADGEIPDLRRAHTAILESAVAAAERYMLINRETDRITTSVNTLAEQARSWVELTRPRTQRNRRMERQPYEI